jgi:predicted nucleic acid-binding protein
MGLMASSLYLDANALIAAVESPKPDLFNCMKRLKARGLELLSSELSLAEVLPNPVKQARADLIDIYEDIIRVGGLVTAIPVGRPILRISVELRTRFGDKLPDAIHLATATMSGCRVIVSSDKRLRLPEGLRRLAAEDVSALESLA